MSREALKTTLNTFLNPTEFEDVIRIPGQSQTAQALTRGASLAAGYGALAMALRTLLRGKGVEHKRDNLSSWASSRYPIISPDKSTRDFRREEDMQNMGLDKVSKNEVAGGLNNILSRVSNFGRQVATGDFSLDEIPTNILGTAAGLYGGYKMSDYIADARRKERTDDELAAKRNQIDKLIYDEFMRTRNMEKGAATAPPSEITAGKKPAGVIDDFKAVSQKPVDSGMRALGGGLTTWAVLSALLAYKYSKDYHDKADPARKRMKQLEAVAKNRAKNRQAPMFMEGNPFPDAPGAISPSRPKPVGRANISTSPKPAINTVDPSDPLAELL